MFDHKHRLYAFPWPDFVLTRDLAVQVVIQGPRMSFKCDLCRLILESSYQLKVHALCFHTKQNQGLIFQTDGKQSRESKLNPAVSFYHTTVNKYRITAITMFQKDGKIFLTIFSSLLFSILHANFTCERVFG